MLRRLLDIRIVFVDHDFGAVRRRAGLQITTQLRQVVRDAFTRAERGGCVDLTIATRPPSSGRARYWSMQGAEKHRRSSQRFALGPAPDETSHVIMLPLDPSHQPGRGTHRLAILDQVALQEIGDRRI